MNIERLSNHFWIVEINGFRRVICHGDSVSQGENSLLLFVDESQPFVLNPLSSMPAHSIQIQNLPSHENENSFSCSPIMRAFLTKLFPALVVGMVATLCTTLPHEAQAPVLTPAQRSTKNHSHFLYVMEKQASTQASLQKTRAISTPQKATQKISTRNPQKIGKNSKNQKEISRKYPVDFLKFLPKDKK